MRRLLSIRTYKEFDVWSWADNQGWGTGHSRCRLGAILLGIKGERRV